MIDLQLINETLGPQWPHGEVTAVLYSERIGEEYGFGGAVHLVEVETRDGAKRLVVKCETLDKVERVVAAYRLMPTSLAENVPHLYGYGETTTLFEYIGSVRQGDGLAVEPGQVEAMVRLLAHLHVATWSSGGMGWIPDHWDGDRWEDRLVRARERYPDQMDDTLFARLTVLHDEIPAAIETLRAGPRALVHMDSGYDNTLWRDDGSPLLLDWSNARIGPPGYDLAGHLAELEPNDVLTTYREALLDRGIRIDVDDLGEMTAAALKVMVRGMLGFAGRPEEPVQPRLLLFRDSVIARIRREIAWLDNS